MIARVWRGATRLHDAEAYVAYLQRTGLVESEDDRFLVRRELSVEHYRLAEAEAEGERG